MGTLLETPARLLLVAARSTRPSRPSGATLFETFMAPREGTRASVISDRLAGYPTRAAPMRRTVERGALLGSLQNTDCDQEPIEQAPRQGEGDGYRSSPIVGSAKGDFHDYSQQDRGFDTAALPTVD